MVNFSQPWLLGLLVPLVGWLSWLLRPVPLRPGEAFMLSSARRRLSLGLRLFSLLLLVLALAGARQRKAVEEYCITFVLDQSYSARRHQARFQDFLQLALAQRPPGVRVAVVHFAGEASLELAASLQPYLPRSTRDLKRDQSDLAGALQFAAAAFPPGMGGRIVLLSDGRETRGSLAQAAEGLQSMGLELDTLIPPQPQDPEALIEELRVPPRVARKTPFDVLVTVYSTVASPKTELQVRRQGVLEGRFGVSLEPGRNVFLLPQPGVERPGPMSYEVRLVAARDGELANNVSRCLTLVEGPARVAVLRQRQSGSRLARLLRAQGLEVDDLSPDRLPQEVGEWLGYQVAVLDNVSSTDFSSDQLEALPALVREAGLGLVMLGGPESFAAGGYSQTPLAEALPLDLRVKRQRLTPPTAQVHVIDKSGSMSQVTRGMEHMALAREASIASMELLTGEDHFGVVAFDDTAKWVVPLQPLRQPKALAGAIGSMRAGGGTDLYPALSQALKALGSSSLSSRHVLVLSDGATAPADFDRLMALANTDKITVSTIAVGEGADRTFLERLARRGKGRCYVADQAQALPRIFARETMLNARSAFDERPTGVVLRESHPLTRGLSVEAAPPLAGHNLSTPRGLPHRVLLETRSGNPLLAAGRYGLGKAVAFTGDSGLRWCSAWSQRSDFAELLTRMVRWTTPPAGLEGLEVSAHLDSLQRLQVRARLAPELGQQALVASLLAPDGSRHELDMLQNGPEGFEASSDLQGEGTFVLVVSSSDGSLRQMLPVQLGQTRELSGVEVQETLLREAARLGGGKAAPTAPEVFRRPRRLPQSYRELAPWLLQLALLALILEVAVRRLPGLPSRPAPGQGQASPQAEVVSLAGSLREKVKRSPRARAELLSQQPPGAPSSSGAPSSPGTPSPPAPTEPPAPGGEALEGLRRVKGRRPRG